jgi:hypothetical protein
MRVSTEHQLALCVHFIKNNHKKTNGSVMLEKEDGLAGGCFAKKSQSSSFVCPCSQHHCIMEPSPRTAMHSLSVSLSGFKYSTPSGLPPLDFRVLINTCLFIFAKTIVQTQEADPNFYIY